MLLKNEGDANPSRIISLVALFIREIECPIVVIGEGNRLALNMVCVSADEILECCDLLQQGSRHVQYGIH
jgi:hypothetical protein